VQIREDYKLLVDQWMHASREYRASADSEQLAVELKVGAGIVASVVAAVTAPGVAVAGLAGGAGAIGALVESYTGTVGGANADDIYNSYQRIYDQLRYSYDQELEQLRLFVVDRNDQILNERPHLYEPLPGTCDVDGPDFRYENFFHDFTPVGGFESRVEAERQKYIAEKNQSSELSLNPIHRALSGSDAERPR
jgi:hypothetical protein